MEVPRPISSSRISERGGGVVQDDGRLDHLDQEGGLALEQRVGGADAGEDAVADADLRPGGGDEAAGLGQDDDQGVLAQVGRLAAHVRAGDDQHLLAVRRDAQVVGDEAAAGRRLDHRVAALLDADGRAVVDLRAHVAAALGELAAGGQDVQHGDAVGVAVQLRREALDRGQDLEVEPLLDGDDLFLGLEDLFLQLLQLGGQKALGVDQRLLADIALRDQLQVAAW